MRLSAILAALAFLLPPLSGQDGPPMTVTELLRLPRESCLVIPRLTGPVTLDGPSDDPGWKGVAPFPLIMQSPTFGEPPSERTEALLGYDDAYVYVAGRLYDREPEGIRAPTKKRDTMVNTTDWFGVLFDTFHDHENALAFFTTPSGLRFDAAVFRDAQGSMLMSKPMNLSWNTFWDVAVVRTAEGWFVEMRIPLTSLRFEEKDGTVCMGLSAVRWIARKNETDVFPAIPKNWGEMSAWKPSQAQETLWPGLRSRHPLYIAPYFLTGSDRASLLNDAGTAYVREGGPELELGLDVKYGLTSNLTLDATVNTDFAQVEADDVQVNLTRYSMYIPEKRLFFQERSSNFDFNMGGPNTLFYSRQVGLRDELPVRIYGGGRLVGRLGGWDIGFLDLQTAAVRGAAGENFGVLRLRRQIINPFSYIGGIVTSRIGTDGRYNAAYGLDGIWRVKNDDYLSFHLAQTFEDGAANRWASLDAARIGLAWERRTHRGLGGSVRYSRTGPGFDPSMGFMMRTSYTSWSGRFLYGWFPGKESFLADHAVNFDGRFYWDGVTKELQSFETGPGWEFTAKSGMTGRFGPKIMFENITETFELSPSASVPPGRYTFPGLDFTLQTPPGNFFNAEIKADVGRFYDGWRVSLGVTPTWSGIPDIELGGIFEYNLVKFPGRGQEYYAPLAQLRVLATLSVKLSASALVQYNGDDRTFVSNVRLRYNPKEGTDLYLVYNEGLNTDRLARFPVPPRSAGRMLALKFSTTFH